MDQYNHENLIKESNLSFALLKEITKDENIYMNNNSIYLYGIPMRDIDNKQLLIYSRDSVKLRRSQKKHYDYFNIFNNSSHMELIIDILYDYNNEIDCICIEDFSTKNNHFSIKIKDSHNKVISETHVYDSNYYKNYILADILLKYYNII